MRWVLRGLLLVALAGGLAACEYPGGMKSSYRAVDHDARLTRVARGALPMIRELAAQRARHGRFPVSPDSLEGQLVQKRDRWHYQPMASGEGYVLSWKLGWDPRLTYVFEKERGRWVFDPGDGSPEKPIVLTP